MHYADFTFQEFDSRVNRNFHMMAKHLQTEAET